MDILLNFYLTLIVLVIIPSIRSQSWKGELFDDKVCQTLPEFSSRIKYQIRRYSNDVKTIMDFVLNGSDKGVTYNQLEIFVDKFGSRYSGTENLENSIDYLKKLLMDEKHDRVYTEDVKIEKWFRGEEWAKMVSPRNKSLSILGLRNSVGTNGIITAPVIVFRSLDELERNHSNIYGKIVVLNYKYENYNNGEYFGSGPTNAGQYGAVAILIKSYTDYSLNSVHAGSVAYFGVEIPSVSITVEDAELLDRITSRGIDVKVSLYMNPEFAGVGKSQNLISELNGYQFPEQCVIVSGHLDSWDIGDGAMDDAGGSFISWRALSVIRKLGLKTKRTLRSVLFTSEEIGTVGSIAYINKHRDELTNLSIIMESDYGTFRPIGLSFSGKSTLSQCIVNEVLQMLEIINCTQLVLNNSNLLSMDTSNFIGLGIPSSGLNTDNDKYRYYQHSYADTLSIEDSNELDLCTVVWTVASYIFSNLDFLIPR